MDRRAGALRQGSGEGCEGLGYLMLGSHACVVSHTHAVQNSAADGYSCMSHGMLCACRLQLPASAAATHPTADEGSPPAAARCKPHAHLPPPLPVLQLLLQLLLPLQVMLLVCLLAAAAAAAGLCPRCSRVT
jgi:hypothetical protein